MARPVIALLTDFGTRDHYAGTMKGVALGICPDATLVDITHDIAPQDVLGGALELAASFKYFPPGTIFLVVVDPGVGSSRRGIAAEAGGYRFVAPDNGVLTMVFREVAAEARRGADRATVCASDREPHLRGTRSVRARGRLARQRYRSHGARADADVMARPRRFPSRRVPRGGSSERCCASIASATW